VTIMNEPDVMIAARDLRRSFGSKLALDRLSLTVRRGEIVGLLGPNGAGKTTTIRLLTGQLAPTAGSATVAGCDLVTDHARLKTQIGVVFEDQNLYERLSAWHNLDFSCRLYGLASSRIDEVLDLVGLRARARDSVRIFSTGMKQRLLIARALLHRPAVLFLDEPSRGLDPLAARDVRQTLAQLCQDGTTVLLTTHLMEEAEQLCQRVAFLVDGRIVADDAPRALQLAHGKRELAVTVDAEQPAHDRASSPDTTTVYTLRMDDPADQARLTHWMAQGQVRAIHSREATLEEVFIEIAGVRLSEEQ
jgi:ABC-2 type transport system ATP-binding protein